MSAQLTEFVAAHRSKLPLLVVTLVALVVPVILGDFLLFLAASILAFGLYGSSFDILFGYTGLLSFGHSVFLGAGAYAAALAVAEHGQSAFAGFLIAITFASALAFVVGLIAIRLKSHGFVILTILVALSFRLLAETFSSITGGTDGIIVTVPPIQLPVVGELLFIDPVVRYYTTLAVVMVSLFFIYRLVNSPVGLVFQMIRENEERAKMLGHNVMVYKLISFVVSGLFAGAAGVLVVYINGFVSSEILSVLVASEAVIFTILGGAATIIGPIFGAILIRGAENYISQITNAYPLLVGVILLLTILFEPRGIVGIATRVRERFVGTNGSTNDGVDYSETVDND